MSLIRLKETFLRLPKQIKLIGIGSLVLAVSVFFPWYADLDAYRIGDQFLGVTGPASFVGIAVLAFAGFSFWVFSYHVRERRVPRLPVREAIVHMFVAGESLFLLFIVNSIFFHPKFGVNITLKESRFGMVMAFAGAALLFFGSYLQNREELKKADDVGKLEPLIKLDDSAKSAVVSSAAAQQTRQHSIVRPAHEPQRRFSPLIKEGTRGLVFGESGAKPAAPAAQKPQAQEQQQTAAKKEGRGDYMLRMDL